MFYTFYIFTIVDQKGGDSSRALVIRVSLFVNVFVPICDTQMKLSLYTAFV